jgi:hypothetical protein
MRNNLTLSNIGDSHPKRKIFQTPQKSLLQGSNVVIPSRMERHLFCYMLSILINLQGTIAHSQTREALVSHKCGDETAESNENKSHSNYTISHS